MFDLLRMARAYHAHIAPPWPLDEDAFLATLLDLPFLDIRKDGFLAGTIEAHPLSPGWIVAKEVMWWAEGSGLSLARNFRRWAKANGAREIQWSCPPGARAERYYRRFAAPVDLTFSEALPWD